MKRGFVEEAPNPHLLAIKKEVVMCSSSSSSRLSSSSFTSATLKTIRQTELPSFLTHFETKEASSSESKEAKEVKRTTEPDYPERAVLIKLKTTCPELANPLMRGLDQLFFFHLLDHKIKKTPLRDILKRFPAAADYLSKIFTALLLKVTEPVNLADYVEKILDIPLIHLDRLIAALFEGNYFINSILSNDPLNLSTASAMLDHPEDADWIRDLGRGLLVGDPVFLTRKRSEENLPPLTKEECLFFKKVFSVCEARPYLERKFIAYIMGLLRNVRNIDSKTKDNWITQIVPSSQENLESIATYLRFDILTAEIFERVIQHPAISEFFLRPTSITSDYLRFFRNIGFISSDCNVLDFLTEQPHLIHMKRRLIHLLNRFTYSPSAFDVISVEDRSSALEWCVHFFKCPIEKIKIIIDLIDQQQLFARPWIQHLATINAKIHGFLAMSEEQLIVQFWQHQIRALLLLELMLPLSQLELETIDKKISDNPEPASHFFRILNWLDRPVNQGWEDDLKEKNTFLIKLLITNLDKLWKFLSDIIVILSFISDNSSRAHSQLKHMWPNPMYYRSQFKFAEGQHPSDNDEAALGMIDMIYHEWRFPSCYLYPHYLAPVIDSFLRHESTRPTWLTDMANLCKQLTEIGMTGKLTQKNIDQLLEGADLNYFLKVGFEYGNVGMDLSNRWISNAKGFYGMSCVIFAKPKGVDDKNICLQTLPVDVLTNIASFLATDDRKTIVKKLRKFYKKTEETAMIKINDEDSTSVVFSPTKKQGVI